MQEYTSFRGYRLVLALAILGLTATSAWALGAGPTLSSVDPSSGPTRGGTTITLNGQNFGTTVSASIGGNDCPITDQTPTVLECTLPEGQGTDQTVQVISDGVPSNVHPFDYLAPSISSLMPSSGPTSGGTRLTIQGANFGTSATATVGGNSCESVVQTPGQEHEELACDAPAGSGEQPVQVNADDQVSNSVPFTYGPEVPGVGALGLLVLGLLMAWALSAWRQRVA